MRLNTFRSTLLAGACLALMAEATLPALASAPVLPPVQKKDEWKNITIASGAAALLGLLTKNGTVTTLGTIGALYSAYRYEQDRKSTDRKARARASLYAKRSVVIDGKRYKRQTVKRHGKTYYRFVRA